MNEVMGRSKSRSHCQSFVLGAFSFSKEGQQTDGVLRSFEGEGEAIVVFGAAKVRLSVHVAAASIPSPLHSTSSFAVLIHRAALLESHARE
ncbi:unnamed protein product [Thelazia callipaeda]|uniref:Uncharacterized protein n=1 Tax=Thelazia callipaeda TaxID=103827 RepID=A0A0N5D8M9_THECL|nr:unnamed protein product [Thelazia callipaeda]